MYKNVDLKINKYSCAAVFLRASFEVDSIGPKITLYADR